MLKVYLVAVTMVGGQVQHSQPLQVPTVEICQRMAAQLIARGVPDGAQAAGAACFVSPLSYAAGDGAGGVK